MHFKLLKPRTYSHRSTGNGIGLKLVTIIILYLYNYDDLQKN